MSTEHGLELTIIPPTGKSHSGTLIFFHGSGSSTFKLIASFKFFAKILIIFENEK